MPTWWGSGPHQALRSHLTPYANICSYGSGLDVTSQGNAYARFTRALSSGSPEGIRLAAGELAQVNLEDALAICLCFLDREPASFPRAAARWAGRLVLERPLTLPDAQLTLAALAALQSDAPRAAGEALIALCERFQIRRGDVVLADWLQRHGLDV